MNSLRRHALSAASAPAIVLCVLALVVPVSAALPAVPGAACAESSGLLALTAIGFGIAAALGVIAVVFRGQARALKRRSLRQESRIDGLQTVEANFRALVSLDQQCCVVWSDSHPRLAVNTLSSALGVPGKVPQLLRFNSWLHPDDAGRLSGYLDRLQTKGEAFVTNASTLEGHVIEVAGSVFGGDHALRIRLFSPVNKEVVRLIGENKRLKQSLQDREKLLDCLPSPIWFRDSKGALNWANRAYVAASGAKSREEVLTRQIELFETRQRAELVRLSQAKKTERLKLQTIVDGAVQTYEAIPAPLDRGSGGAAFDVAPLAVAKEELERQMSAHSRTLDKVATGIAIFGPEKSLTYSNDAFAQMWGLQSDWLAQRPSVTEFFDVLRQRRMLPDQADYRKWREERVSARGLDKPIAELWHRPDGRTVNVSADFRDDGGLTFLFDDVTAELTLQRQYHSLIDSQRETLDHLSEGIALFGTDGRLQLFNPAFQQIWKLPPDALENSPHFRDIVTSCQWLVSDEDFWIELQQAVTGLPEVRDTKTGTVDRSDETNLSYTVTPLPDGSTLATFSDITDRRRFEQVLLERNEALEASDRLKTAFLSHVSYELRTPLTSIIGFTDLLAEPAIGPLNDRQRDYLNDIKTSSQMLLNIINDIIDLAVIDAGAMDLKLAPVEIKDIVEAAQLGVRERLSKARVHLDVRIGSAAGTVMADANRLTQVLYNLLSNAIGFSPEDGTITLNCRKENGGIVISVQDTGLGIPEDEQASVFERFESRTKGSRHRGAGLGLSLVKSIVELHKGRIELRSTPGAGTTVNVFLPDDHPGLGQKARNGLSMGANAMLPAQS
jgi:signal transduction histidine kinase